MKPIILAQSTLDVIITAYNSGVLAYGALTLKAGAIAVELDIRSSNYNILTIIASGVVNTLTLWDSDDNHGDIIRLHFGEGK